MKAFRHWGGARIGLLAGAWIIGFPLVSAFLMTLQARRDFHAYALQSGVSPPQTSDIYVVVAWRELIVLAVLVVLPPLLLVVAWRRARARGDGDRDAPT